MKLSETGLDYSQAIELQEQLKNQIKLEGWKGYPRLIGGTDISYDKKKDLLYAAIVVLDFVTLEIISYASHIGKVTFPYIPGLLSFREVPALMEAFKNLKIIPDVIMVDGQGYAHPRRIGLASHFGLLINKPTIGVAKSRLIGEFQEPDSEKGAYTELRDGNELIGYVLRSRENVKPIFVSPGHLIDFEWSLKITIGSLSKYRIPEPTRQAHILVNKIRKENEKI